MAEKILISKARLRRLIKDIVDALETAQARIDELSDYMPGYKNSLYADERAINRLRKDYEDMAREVEGGGILRAWRSHCGTN